MHMAGEPATMNVAPRYEQCALEVFDWLAARVAACEAAGLARERMMVDPGLCFGKHEPDNLDLLRHLALFHGLGCPVLLGASRKGWTAALETGWPAAERLPATLAAAQWALDQGVQLLRVHDVAAHAQLLTAWRALADLADATDAGEADDRRVGGTVGVIGLGAMGMGMARSAAAARASPCRASTCGRRRARPWRPRAGPPPPRRRRPARVPGCFW